MNRREWLVANPQLPVRLAVDPWAEEHGVPVLSRYAEEYWLQILGPTCLLLARKVNRRLLAEGGDVNGVPSSMFMVFDLAELGCELGLGAAATPVSGASPIVRSWERLIEWKAASILPDGVGVAVVSYLPRLSRVQVDRLPRRLREKHEAERLAAVNRG